MNIHEYQAKEPLRSFGIPVPLGEVVYSDWGAARVAEEIGGQRWVVKAQVHAGGRGKAGGVPMADSGFGPDLAAGVRLRRASDMASIEQVLALRRAQDEWVAKRYHNLSDAAMMRDELSQHGAYTRCHPARITWVRNHRVRGRQWAHREQNRRPRCAGRRPRCLVERGGSQVNAFRARTEPMSEPRGRILKGEHERRPREGRISPSGAWLPRRCRLPGAYQSGGSSGS